MPTELVGLQLPNILLLSGELSSACVVHLKIKLIEELETAFFVRLGQEEERQADACFPSEISLDLSGCSVGTRRSLSQTNWVSGGGCDGPPPGLLEGASPPPPAVPLRTLSQVFVLLVHEIFKKNKTRHLLKAQLGNT